MNKFDQELFSAERYERIFTKLRQAGVKEPWTLHTAPITKDMTLGWTLSRQNLVVSSIQKFLRSSNLQFSAYKKTSMFSGKMRDIYQADWPERILLMVMAEILTENLAPLLPAQVYSFQKGKSSLQALKDFQNYVKRNQNAYVLKRDISSYGDSIPQESLMTAFKQTFHVDESSTFVRLLRANCRIRFLQGEETKELLVGIPSGSPLVPPLENFYLISLDHLLISIPNSFYMRYGDDFLFASPDQALVQHVEKMIDTHVTALGLKIKPAKRVNLQLTNPGGNKAADFNPGFPAATHIQTLGRSINRHGALGPKRDHFTQLHRSYRSFLRDVCDKLQAANLNQADSLELTSSLLRKFFSPSTNPDLNQIIVHNNNHDLFKMFDHFRTKEFIRTYSRRMKVPRTVAWKVYRKIKIPSILGLIISRHEPNQPDQKSHFLKSPFVTHPAEIDHDYRRTA